MDSNDRVENFISDEGDITLEKLTHSEKQHAYSNLNGIVRTAKEEDKLRQLDKYFGVDTAVRKKINNYLSNDDISVDTLDRYALYEAKRMLNKDKLLLSPQEKIKKKEVDKKFNNSERPNILSEKAIRFLDGDKTHRHRKK